MPPDTPVLITKALRGCSPHTGQERPLLARRRGIRSDTL